MIDISTCSMYCCLAPPPATPIPTFLGWKFYFELRSQFAASLLRTYTKTTGRIPPFVLDRAINCPPYKIVLISESSFPASIRSAIAVRSLQWPSPASKRVGRWGAEALNYLIHMTIREKRCVRCSWRLLGWSAAVYILCCQSGRLVFVDRRLVSGICLQKLEVMSFVRWGMSFHHCKVCAAQLWNSHFKFGLHRWCKELIFVSGLAWIFNGCSSW